MRIWRTKAVPKAVKVEVRRDSRSATNSALVNARETVRWRAENGGPGRVAWNVTTCERLVLGLLGGGAVVLTRMKGVVARLALLRAARAVRSNACGRLV